MSIVMRAACVILVIAIGCTPERPATDDSANASANASAIAAQEPEGMTHLEMYAMSATMPIDQAVFSELAADTSVIQLPASPVATKLDGKRLLAKLAKDGYAPGSERLKATLAVFRETARSSVAGDDQALVVSEQGGTFRYGPVVHLGVPDKIVNERTFTNGKFHWIASLANISAEGYEGLKIAPGVARCLYAGNSVTNGYSAYWHQPDISKGCDGTGELDESVFMAQARLLVLRTAAKDVGKDFGESDIPAAARFEWGANKAQMIGVKCGDAWCQVALPGTSPADLEPTPSAPPTDKYEARNRRMKGRFDYQMLADKRADGTLFPSGIVAQIRALKEANMKTPNNDKAYSVAEVVIHHNAAKLPVKYEKLGFGYGTNTITFCRGSYANCGGTSSQIPTPCAGTPIWGRVIRDNGEQGDLFPICYLKSTSPKDLWITRWSWLPNDEEFWVRCLNGCCSPQEIER
jgi:hypothetical protein